MAAMSNTARQNHSDRLTRLEVQFEQAGIQHNAAITSLRDMISERDGGMKTLIEEIRQEGRKFEAARQKDVERADGDRDGLHRMLGQEISAVKYIAEQMKDHKTEIAGIRNAVDKGEALVSKGEGIWWFMTKLTTGVVATGAFVLGLFQYFRPLK